MSEHKSVPEWFKCTESNSPIFTAGVAYEVHSYVDGSPRICTDNEFLTVILPSKNATFEPYDPWAIQRGASK